MHQSEKLPEIKETADTTREESSRRRRQEVSKISRQISRRKEVTARQENLAQFLA
jgi:hypothetical protein